MAKIYIPTFGEEVGNTISHGVMSILMLLALPFAAAYSYSSSGDALLTFGVSLFCVSLFMMFLISTTRAIRRYSIFSTIYLYM